MTRIIKSQISFILLACFLTAMLGCAHQQITPGVNSELYARAIVDSDDVAEEDKLPNLLGPTSFPSGIQHKSVTLGAGWVVVDMGQYEEIIDKPGPDLRIYEDDRRFNPDWRDDLYRVFVSSDNETWQSLGYGRGTKEFDLASSKLKEARYVKIKGYVESPGPTAGPDIEAIESLHPSGKKAPVSAQAPIQLSGSQDLDIGNYHAFIVGINAYTEWYPLKTAVQDATALKDVLITQYGFDKVLLITDTEATQLNVINNLKNFAADLNENDNLLIYYAGHGQLDEFTGDGYWIPVEGKHKNPGTWISHLLVKSILSSERIKAKNIALVSDSCYAGALLRRGLSPVATTDDHYQGKILALSTRKSRQVFTSGGLEPVADGGRDGHSLFAYYFLKALKENKRDVIDLENLFYRHVWGPVAEIGNQRPYAGRLRTMMDENGQFVLISAAARDKDRGRLVDVNVATVSPELYLSPASGPDFDPAKPWAGEWEVDGGYKASGMWILMQTGKEVKSTIHSFYHITAEAEGNILKGHLNAEKSYRFSIIMSQDYQSFEGTAGESNFRVKGKRKE